MKDNLCSNDLDWSNRRFLIEVTQAESKDLKGGEIKPGIKSRDYTSKTTNGYLNSCKMAPIQQRKITIPATETLRKKIEGKKIAAEMCLPA